MRRTSVFERVSIVAEALALRIERGVVATHILAKLGVGVNALGAGHDFLTAHEEVEGVGEARVFGVGGSVERSNDSWEFVHGEKVA